MSVNNSTSSSDSSCPSDIGCPFSGPGSFVLLTSIITYILLLLPLCIFILHHGLQQWRQKRSTSSAVTVSHSDCFTYHVAVMELIGVFGCALLLCGLYRKYSNMIMVGGLSSAFVWFGQMLLHVLTCVERYLAVVHPITYLSLRNQRGIRIRNISIACVWLLCLALMNSLLQTRSYTVVNFCFLLFSLIVISFCSLSVLCVLIRPGPGEQGGDRERVDQSKNRAFYTIMSILGVLVLRFAWGLLWAILSMSIGNERYVFMASQVWFSLPSSLVLPLLYLHRADKLVCWKKNIQRGRD